MYWYAKVIKNYFEFDGRARRKEYWMFTLVNALIILAISIFETVLGMPGLIYVLYSVFVFIPGLAVTVRRLHDTGKTGWWVLIGFIPIAGAIVLIVFECIDSYPYENKYGPNPKFSI
ncbi:DUF805 domain-containing protein [Virgibacillus doumboii]|uniref:DUF805 domain-containing protein n=1 Tax=Virgibacillus doumboii TaxID=2697503 RepID=UPI0013E00E0C|nr:DUF805 domain-containing protein [Virgibacillus doumboii]